MDATATNPATILIVDDDANNIQILSKLLEPAYTIVAATSGEEALECVLSNRPDLILLDVMMPGMDGFEVCSRLKEDRATANIPVIFLTAVNDTEAESKALELGALDFVTKPFKPAVVRARVRNHVELKRMHDVMHSLAVSDGLTGLANRRRFDEVMDDECKRLARTKAPLSLIMLDIDHFKAFNDTYGHVAGDDCLRRVGHAIAAEMRRSPDIAARYGGEEFACVLPETDPEGAASLAERIRAAIEMLAIPHAGSKTATVVTASVGVATVECSPTTLPTQLVHAADSCLYQAKTGGRNRVVSRATV